MTKETQTALNTQKLDFLATRFDEHCTKQNNSMEKFAEVLEEQRKDNSKGHERIHEKMDEIKTKQDERDKKSISKLQALLYGILGSATTGLLLYVMIGK